MADLFLKIDGDEICDAIADSIRARHPNHDAVSVSLKIRGGTFTAEIKLQPRQQRRLEG